MCVCVCGLESLFNINNAPSEKCDGNSSKCPRDLYKVAAFAPFVILVHKHTNFLKYTHIDYMHTTNLLTTIMPLGGSPALTLI